MVFSDRPTSIKKAQDRRVGELALIGAIHSGAIDKVLIYGIDRIGKSLIDLVGFLETCRAGGVSLWVDEQKLDTVRRMGSHCSMWRLCWPHICGKVVGMVYLRGQAAARSLCIRFGRPPLGKAKIEKARQELAAGKGVRQVARLAGISAASVSRLKNSIGLSAS